MCKVDGCNNGKVFAKGFCNSHYKRNRLYGNPTGGKSYKGEVVNFLSDAISSNTQECILSPYSRNKGGYSRVNIKGKTILSHVFVLESVSKKKLKINNEVIHSCGNGHLGCVNPKHLSWGTREQNVKDAILHGSKHSGSKKFSDREVSEMRKLLKEGVDHFTVSEKYNISPSYLNKIRLNKAR